MIREFILKDVKDCISIVDVVWKVTEKFPPLELSELFLEIYTIGSLDNSNYSLVYEENNKIVGFLFGHSAKGKCFKTKYTGLIGKVKLFINLMFLKNVTLKVKLNMISMFNIHEKNRLSAEPDRKYEVNLFAVLPSMQGKGIGKELMKAFIEKCNLDGVKRITLDTDEECNYKFYENFGYYKKAEFYSPIQYLYTGKTGVSFVYELNIV